MKRHTAPWVRKAEADTTAARKLAVTDEPQRDVVCFLCQQSVEKYFKAMLQEHGAVVPKTHNLNNLLDLLLPYDETLKSLRRGLKGLTHFAVEYRYPGERARTRDMQSALRIAERVRAEIRARLGLSV